MNAMTNFRKTWYMGSSGHKYYPCGLSSLNAHINTSFAFLFWLANNKKKSKYLEFCKGYSDETWYVGSGWYKYYPHGLSSPNVHI